MTVAQFIEWLKTQDQEATVCVTWEEGPKYRQEFDPDMHAEALETRWSRETWLVLGRHIDV